MAARDRLGELRSGNTQYRSPSGSLNNLNEIGRPSGSLQNSRPSGSLNNLHEMSSRPTGSFNNLYEMSTRPAPSEFTVQINQLFSGIDRIEGNLTTIQRLHERALVGVSQDEINRITRQVDSVQDETNDLMDRVRVELKTLAEETKQEKGPEQQSRKAQQASVATKLQQVAQRYAQIQKNAKEQYKKRMEREIRIARPDASPADIQRAVDSKQGSAFAQEMLNSRVGAQRRVLQEVQSRHEELRKMEQSIEELATLFMDLQAQQESINTIETQVNYTVQHIEEGGTEIKRAISIRKASRKKLWCIVVFILVLIAILGVVGYIQACAWFRVNCPA